MPDRVHEMKPSRRSAGERPVDLVAEDGHGAVEPRLGRSGPIGLIERTDRRSNRMGHRVLGDDRPVVLYEPIAPGGKKDEDRRGEHQPRRRSHGRSRAHRDAQVRRESLVAWSPRE